MTEPIRRRRSEGPAARGWPGAKLILAAILPPVLAALLQWQLWPWITPYAWVLFFPAVLFSARLGNFRSGLASTALGAALAWYFFLPPQGGWEKAEVSSLASMLTFLIVGYLVSTIHEQLHRAQRSTEARFEATFEQAAVGIALVMPDGRWERVNRKLSNITGYRSEELLAMTFQDITHPDDLETDLEQVRRMLLREIRTYSLEKRYLRKDGRTVWINLTVSLAWKPNGAPGYFIAVIEDIQARKLMEDSLRESEERLQLFIRYAPAPLAMFDAQMRYLAVSRRWLEDYRLREQDIVGRSHYELFPDIPDRWREAHRQGLAGEVLRAEEDCFERVDGTTQWLRWEIHPWHRSDGTVGGIVIFTEDITRYKRALEEIHRLNTDLEQRVEERTAELLAANRELDAFAYAVSHDLRAPLRAMSGFSQILEEKYASHLEGEAPRYLQQIRLASRKMGDLIDGILALSRINREKLRRDEIDLSALAEHLLADMAAREPERRVGWQVEPGLRTRGDARLVEALMANLLGNAWKYTARVPEALIRVHRQERCPDQDRNHDQNPGHPPEQESHPQGGLEGVFCVADNGAGFDMARAGQLFQPFQRLHHQEEFPGMGIGLATVQRIVHRHGGRITASAAPGQGATFCFSLGDAPAPPTRAGPGRDPGE